MFYIGINSHLDLKYQKWFKNQMMYEQAQSSLEMQSIKASKLAYEYVYLASNDPEDLEVIKSYEDQLAVQMQWYMTTRNILNERDKIERLKYEIEREELLLTFYESGERDVTPYLYEGSKPNYLKSSIAVKSYLYENKIKPLTSPFEMVGHNFITKFLSYQGLLVWAIIAVLLTVDVFAGDMTSGTYKTIYSFDGNRIQVIFVKWLSSMINVIGIFVFCIFIFAMYFYLQGNLGNINYPVSKNMMAIVPWFKTLPYTLSIAILMLTMVITLSYTVGVKIKGVSESFVIILSIFVADFMIRSFVPLNQNFWNYYPLTGLDAQGYFTYGNGMAAGAQIIVITILMIVTLGGITVYNFAREDL